MKEVILTLLQAVLSVAIPVATAYLVSFLKKKSAQAQAQIDNETAKHYMEEITAAVTTAVTATSQTYVDALKKENAFTKEAQAEAFDKAMQTAIAILSNEAIEFIYEVHGDLNEYLTPKIEETVKVLKNTDGAYIGLPVETLDTTEE